MSKIHFITDFMMPAMTGLDLLSTLRTMNVQAPALLLSGCVEKDVAIQALNVGVVKIVEKPASSETLLRAIDRVLLERKIDEVRKLIRESTAEIKELYSSFRAITAIFSRPGH